MKFVKSTKYFGEVGESLINIADKSDSAKQKYYKFKHKLNRVGNAITRGVTGYDQSDVNALNKKAGLNNWQIIKNSLSYSGKKDMDDVTTGVKNAAKELNNARNKINEIKAKKFSKTNQMIYDEEIRKNLAKELSKLKKDRPSYLDDYGLDDSRINAARSSAIAAQYLKTQ